MTVNNKLRGKIYSPDETLFVYAFNAESALEIYNEETGCEYELSDLVEYSLDDVAYGYEMIGIGGCGTIEFITVVRYFEKLGLECPYYIGEVDKLHDDIFYVDYSYGGYF